jgi:glycosyltransferase involved in cell wall biosynthesis
MNEPTTRDRAIAEDLTVVIPTLGREILRDSLAAIAGGSELPARVIVVHQGDDPRVGEWARRAPGGMVVEYVRSDRRGRATGVNTGIDRVTTPFVAITDDDCLADPEWVHGMAARLRAEPDRLVMGE